MDTDDILKLLKSNLTTKSLKKVFCEWLGYTEVNEILDIRESSFYELINKQYGNISKSNIDFSRELQGDPEFKIIATHKSQGRKFSIFHFDYGYANSLFTRGTIRLIACEIASKMDHCLIVFSSSRGNWFIRPSLDEKKNTLKLYYLKNSNPRFLQQVLNEINLHEEENRNFNQLVENYRYSFSPRYARHTRNQLMEQYSEIIKQEFQQHNKDQEVNQRISLRNMGLYGGVIRAYLNLAYFLTHFTPGRSRSIYYKFQNTPDTEIASYAKREDKKDFFPDCLVPFIEGKEDQLGFLPIGLPKNKISVLLGFEPKNQAKFEEAKSIISKTITNGVFGRLLQIYESIPFTYKIDTIYDFEVACNPLFDHTDFADELSYNLYEKTISYLSGMATLILVNYLSESGIEYEFLDYFKGCSPNELLTRTTRKNLRCLLNKSQAKAVFTLIMGRRKAGSESWKNLPFSAFNPNIISGIFLIYIFIAAYNILKIVNDIYPDLNLLDSFLQYEESEDPGTSVYFHSYQESQIKDIVFPLQLFKNSFFGIAITDYFSTQCFLLFWSLVNEIDSRSYLYFETFNDNFKIVDAPQGLKQGFDVIISDFYTKQILENDYQVDNFNFFKFLLKTYGLLSKTGALHGVLHRCDFYPGFYSTSQEVAREKMGKTLAKYFKGFNDHDSDPGINKPIKTPPKDLVADIGYDFEERLEKRLKIILKKYFKNFGDNNLAKTPFEPNLGSLIRIHNFGDDQLGEIYHVLKIKRIEDETLAPENIDFHLKVLLDEFPRVARPFEVKLEFKKDFKKEREYFVQINGKEEALSLTIYTELLWYSLAYKETPDPVKYYPDNTDEDNLRQVATQIRKIFKERYSNIDTKDLFWNDYGKGYQFKFNFGNLIIEIDDGVEEELIGYFNEEITKLQKQNTKQNKTKFSNLQERKNRFINKPWRER